MMTELAMFGIGVVVGSAGTIVMLIVADLYYED